MRGLPARVVVLAGILGAAAALGFSAPAATAQTLPITYDLGVVLPGETRTMERPIEIPRDAAVASAGFDSAAAHAGWNIQLCAEDCIAVDALAGSILDAGDYRLVVTLTMPADGVAVLETSAWGSLTLVDAGVAGSETLPSTGGNLPVASMAVGAALAAGGTLLVVLAGRRRVRRGEVSA